MTELQYPKPIFEIRMKPKARDASIKRIDVLVNDYDNIYTSDMAIDFVEKQFPMYEVEHVLKGYQYEPK